MCSIAILVDSQALIIQLLLILLPLRVVEFSESLISENFQLAVSLFELSIHCCLIELITLTNGELLFRFMPFSVAADGIELACVSLIMSLVIFHRTSLHDLVLRVSEIRPFICLHCHDSVTFFY